MTTPDAPPTTWRQRRRERAAGRGVVRRWLRRLLLAGAAVVAVLAVAVGVAYARTSVPDAKDVATAQTTIVTYADGEELGRFGQVNRIDVPLSDVPLDVQHAVLAAENRNFYSEPGISLLGIARAAWANLRGGGIAQGGSTITQQYVKNAALSQERTFTRKAKEILIALKLDRTRSKDQILEDYLNTIYFGRGAYGIETAAQAYFGVPARDLTLEQGAVLAAVIRAPGNYDPRTNAARLADRFRYVLRGMVDKGWLDPARAGRAAVPAVAPSPTPSNAFGGPQGYLLKQVQDELAAHGFSDDEISRAGFTVATTLRKPLQDAAVRAVDQVLGDAKSPQLFSPLVAVEPGTGRILAEYAGPDYIARPLNAVTQATAQAGSSFKPFVLAAALRQGIGLRTRYDGNSPLDVPGYGKPVPNFNDESFGRINLVTATAQSVNTVYVPLAIDATLPAVKQAAVDAGVPADEVDLAAGASIALGQPSVHPLDMAQAYATFAAGGKYADAHLVEKVTRQDGTVAFIGRPRTRQAFDPAVVRDLTYALEQVVDQGTATAAQLAQGRPAAGKTGTTDEYRAAWFVGYTPQIATAVAMFHPDNSPLVDIAGVRSVTGGSLPARIWKAFTDAALAGAPQVNFPDPSWVGSSSGGGRSMSPSRAPARSRASAPPRSRTRSPAPSDSPSPADRSAASPPGTPSADGGRSTASGGPSPSRVTPTVPGATRSAASTSPSGRRSPTSPRPSTSQ